MAFQIRISPDALRNAAQEITRIMDENQSISGHMKTLVHRLDEAWSGDASLQMVDKLNQICDVVFSGGDALGESADILQQVAHAFESIDEGETNIPTISFVVTPQIGVKCGQALVLHTIRFNSGYVRVVPEELRQVARECNDISDNFREVVERITQITDTLHNDWEGNSFNRFSETFNEVRIVYINLSEALDEFAHKVRNAADSYEAIDNMFG